MPKQLKRLLPLFVIFIGIFLLIRHFLIPDSFGQYGHYRGDALLDNSNREIVYSEMEVCIQCHDDIQEQLETDMHAGLSCVICHGPGLKHTESMESSDIEVPEGRKFCGTCHSINPARSPDVILQVDITEHHIERNDCIDCHNPHQVWELKE